MCSQPSSPVQPYSPPESSSSYERDIFDEYQWLVDHLEYLKNEALELRDVFRQVYRCEITQTEFQRDTLIEQIDSVWAEIEITNESIEACAWIRQEELDRAYKKVRAWIEEQERDFREVKVEPARGFEEARGWECDNTERSLEGINGGGCGEFERRLDSTKPIGLGLNIEDFINYHSSCHLDGSVRTWASCETDQTLFEDFDNSTYQDDGRGPGHEGER